MDASPKETTTMSNIDMDNKKSSRTTLKIDDEEVKMLKREALL